MSTEHVHLIGIGGTGMASLAGLLQASGCRVTGSDGPLYPPTSEILARLGPEVYTGFSAAHLDPAPDLTVVGNAVSRGNPEVEHVLDQRLPYTSMPRLIAQRFLTGRHSIVVAGTHGKTTTASMLAWVLHRAGRDPGFLIGGMPFNFDHSFRLGRGEAFVIEGDEYDSAFFDKGPKFMHYRPDTLLVGSVEFDHADIYDDLEQIKTAFKRLVNIVPRRGLLVRHEENPASVEVSARAFCRVEGYGFERGQWRAVDYAETDDGACCTLLHRGRPFAELSLAMSGRHNVRNAMAVVAAAREQGLSAEEIAEGLRSFRGVRRRLELRGEVGGIRVYDDFAHHPTAIAETLRTLRSRHAKQRIWAVLEPRSWSLRRNVFAERLESVFDAADAVLIADVFGAQALPPEQRLDVAALAAALRRRGREAAHLDGAEGILRHLLTHAAAGDVVVIMSNGGFDGLHQRLLDSLAGSGDRVRHVHG